METTQTVAGKARSIEKAVEQLMKEIRNEHVPERLLALARAFQAALDSSRRLG